MALKTWDPSGTPGTYLVDTPNRPTELANVVNTTGTQLQYDASAGAARGSNIGIHAVATAAADVASMRMDNTQLASGSARCYARFRAWPSVNTDTFGLRSSAANAIRMFVGTTGLATVQNSGGTNIAGLSYQLSLNTWYRLSLQATPGTTTTTGVGAAQIYSDSDALLAELPVTTGLNLGTTANVLSARMGKNGATGTFDGDFTQLAFDTTSTTPVILAGASKIVTNTAPTSNAGVDLTVEPGQPYTLTATDADVDNNISTRVWTLAGTQVGTGKTYSDVGPLTLNGGTLTYTYTVTDTGGLQTSDTVVVNYLPAARQIFDGTNMRSSYRDVYTG